MNDNRNPNVKNNNPRPDQRRPIERPAGAEQRQGQPPQRPTAPRQNPPVQRTQRPTSPQSRPNVTLSGSLNTGNFRVQNTSSFSSQATGGFKPQSTGNFRTAPQGTGNFRPVSEGGRRPMVEDESVRRAEPRRELRPEPRFSEERRPTPHRSRDDYLVWFLILAIVLLVALIVTFIIIKTTDPADNSGAKLPDDGSVSVGVNDPNDNNGATALQWAVVPSNLKAFVPKSTASTKTVSSGTLHSAAAIMVDLSTGEVVSEYHPDTVIYPASLTKVMTVIVACEMIKDMDDTFTLTTEIVDPLFREGASRANFCTGYPITMKELVYGAILPSGADACIALATKLCGSETAFVEKMNEKAASIGCTSTRFVNCTGLHDDGHYSTVRDMANILSYAMNNPFLRAVLSTESYTTTAPLGNESSGFYYNLYCIWASRYSGNKSKNGTMFAAKTGYTPEAGQCLASVSVTDDGKEYVIVTVGAKSVSNDDAKPKPYKDAKYLLDTYIE